MNILEALVKLRDDLKTWVTNNLNYKLNKNLGIEKSSRILVTDGSGEITTTDALNGISIGCAEVREESLWIDTGSVVNTSDKTQLRISAVQASDGDGTIEHLNRAAVLYVYNDDGSVQGEYELYGQHNKPTPDDIGSISIEVSDTQPSNQSIGSMWFKIV